jgi:hypothetical protein
MWNLKKLASQMWRVEYQKWRGPGEGRMGRVQSMHTSRISPCILCCGREAVFI